MRALDADPALNALFIPFEEGLLEYAADALFLRARHDMRLRRFGEAGPLVQQNIKTFSNRLEMYGFIQGHPPQDARYAEVLLLPPRQRDESRAVFACALRHCRAGGTVVASVANAEGAKAAQADLARLAGPLQCISKHKCRVFWTAPIGDQVDQELLAEWLALDTPRENNAGFLSRPGLFAWDRADPGSILLGEHLPATLHGRVADLGAGYGYLATRVINQCAQVESMNLYESDARALEPARRNVARALDNCARDVDIGIHWHDVRSGLSGQYDAIVTNPPFHLGRADMPELGRAFIAASADALRAHGCLWLVANRHLAYESVLHERFAAVRQVAQVQGFKVIEAKGPRG